MPRYDNSIEESEVVRVYTYEDTFTPRISVIYKTAEGKEKDQFFCKEEIAEFLNKATGIKNNVKEPIISQWIVQRIIEDTKAKGKKVIYKEKDGYQYNTVTKENAQIISQEEKDKKLLIARNNSDNTSCSVTNNDLGNAFSNNKALTVKHGSSMVLAEKYDELFDDSDENTLNGIVQRCIVRMPLLEEVLEKSTGRKDHMGGMCLAISNLAGFLLKSKEDFDALYSLTDCNVKELNAKNFRKFLNGELENGKLQEVFSFVQMIVEYSPLLEAENINLKMNLGGCRDCKKELPTKSLIQYECGLSDTCNAQIIISRVVVLNILKELQTGNTLSFHTGYHVMSITKTPNGCIFSDPNKRNYLGPLSEEKVCDVMELAINKYWFKSSTSYKHDYPYIELANSTEVMKKVLAHYTEYKEGNVHSTIEDLKLQAFQKGFTEKYVGSIPI